METPENMTPAGMYRPFVIPRSPRTPDQGDRTSVCGACGALVAATLEDAHTDYHRALERQNGILRALVKRFGLIG